MANTLIQKVIAVSVLVVLVLGAFVPVIASIGSTSETTTETRTYATNSLEGYSDAITASSRGNVASITTYRADSDGTANASGDWVYYPIDALSMLGGKVNAAGTIYANVSSTWVATDLSAQTLPYTVTYAGGTQISFTADPDNAAIADVALTVKGSSVSAVLLPYDVTYYVNTTLTYGTNSIHSLVLTDTVGDIAAGSGTSYDFTANAGGDWLQIPAHILRDTTQTYKVLDGSYIYVSSFLYSGSYEQHTIDGTPISAYGMTLAFTQDTSITTATVYNMTATVTDLDIPGVVIEHEVQTSSVVYPSTAKIANTADEDTRSTYLLTTAGDLYYKGANNYGQGGLGNKISVQNWTLTATNVADVQAVDGFAAYLSTTGQLFISGRAHSFGYATATELTSWTQIANPSGEENASIISFQLAGDRNNQYCAAHAQITIGNNTYNRLFYTGYYLKTDFSWQTVSNTVSYYYVNDGSLFYIDGNGDLYARGLNSAGQLGTGNNSNYSTTFNKVASNVSSAVISGELADSTGFYVSTSGELYATGYSYDGKWGDGGVGSGYSWTKVVNSGVSEVIPSQNGTFYLSTTKELYWAGTNVSQSGIGTSSGTDYNTWTLSASDVEKVYSAGKTRSFSYYIDDAGKLYYAGSGWNGMTGKGNSSNYRTWTETATGAVDVFIAPKATSYGGVSAYVNSSNEAYLVGGLDMTSQTVTSSWTKLSILSTSTIYTNPTETETVSDLRGTMSGNTFTADPDGDYLYVPIEDAVDYAYYVSVGSTVYAPNTLGNALAAHTVPDVTGIDPAVTITLTQVAGYNDQIYSVTATTTDTDIVGWAIPYTVTYAGVVDTHYAYNYVGLVGYAFSNASDGSYLKVPYPMTATNGFSYFIDYQDGFYYLDTDGELVSDTAEGEESIGSATKTLISVGAADDGVCPIELSNGTDGGYMVIPYAYTGGTNEVSAYIITYTPVRGNVSGGSFSAAADGDYIALYSENLENETYYIGTGQAYYVVEAFGTVMETVEAPAGITAVYGAVSFVPTGDNEDVYTVSGSTLSDYGVVVPYTATYEEVTTVVTEIMPMVSIVIVAIIVLVLLGVISLIPNFRGGL